MPHWIRNAANILTFMGVGMSLTVLCPARLPAEQTGTGRAAAGMASIATRATPISAAGLEIGQAAPDFILPDESGKLHHLADYRGRTVVLMFYPTDFTPG